MNNMKMWPISNNPTVQPPIIRKMPGRPSKARRKEAGESKKTGKLSKGGSVMTCSSCHTKGHNKRGCPTRPTQTAPSQADHSQPDLSQATETSTQSQARTNNGKANKRRMEQEIAENERVTGRGRERGRGRGRGRWMQEQAQAQAQVQVQAQEQVTKETDIGQASRPYKRPNIVGVGVLVADDGFTTLNPDMPGRRVIDTGTRVTRRSDEVTGDIGYQPCFGVKWKGKSAITSNKLEQMRGERIVQTRSAAAAAAANQSQTSTTRKPPRLWK